jgi:hypothetical protein
MCHPFLPAGGDSTHVTIKVLTFFTSSFLHFHLTHFLHSLLSLIPFTMPPFHVAHISTAVWKWLRRCPDVIGPVQDTSSDEEFYTPPTSPLRPAQENANETVFMPQPLREQTLSPAQSARLRRRHAEAVRQLTTPTPKVAPPPQGPLLPYQRPIKVYRPSWAP